MIRQNRHPQDWKDFQKRLKRKGRRTHLAFRSTLLFTYIVLIGSIYYASGILAQGGKEDGEQSWENQSENIGAEQYIKQDLPDLIASLNLDFSAETQKHLLVAGERQFTAHIPVHSDLQAYVTKLLSRSQTYQAAVVVMKPKTGQILAMASFDKDGPGEENLCLKADFPAASIIKIISAAAAIEACGFTPEKPLFFTGMKHTLYKSQLKQDEGRYSTKTSFKKAFSESINPVFGKIGIFDLGEEFLSEYARRFLFNQSIPFDLPLAASSMQIPEHDFGLAEVASGFNKETLISPLHASLITATVANYGIMIEPWLVRSLQDASGETLYRARRSYLGRAITEATARQIKVLMKDTAVNGTAGKAFRPLRRKKAFRDFEFGAKTGTINDRQDQYKYDWITAYVIPKDQKKSVCITVLAVHGKMLGIRAAEMAQRIIDRHYTS